MTSDRTILITGVTGKQDGAVAQALKGRGFRLRGLMRRPDSELSARVRGAACSVCPWLGGFTASFPDSLPSPGRRVFQRM